MRQQLKTLGSPSLDELRKTQAFPDKEIYMKGPVAFVECIEEIPCNPCQTACKRGAINVGYPITNLPFVNFKKCSGCGLCVAACPGLAIYTKDYTHSDLFAIISFPFEYLPLPEAGDVVVMVNRFGEEICEGKVIRLLQPKSYDRTTVVTAEFPKAFFEEVVSMKVPQRA